MIILILFFLFLFGLAVGSFINVVVYRLNNLNAFRSRIGTNPRSWIVGNFKVLGGRSFCPRCKHQLAWHDNLPLLSFAILRGKCRYCQKKISWQYPIVELVTGVLTLLIFNFQFVPTSSRILGFTGTIFNLFIVYSLIAIFVSDLTFTTIPDQFSYPAIAASFFYRLLNFQVDFFLAGTGAFLFFLFLHLLTRGKGMAFGDVKLALLLGLFLGWPATLISLYLAFLTGALVGVILILTKVKKLGQPIPFGPFLVGGALVALFWGERIANFYLSLLKL